MTQHDELTEMVVMQRVVVVEPVPAIERLPPPGPSVTRRFFRKVEKWLSGMIGVSMLGGALVALIKDGDWGVALILGLVAGFFFWLASDD